MGASSQSNVMIFPSSISINDVNQIRNRLVEEYRQFPSNLKRDGTAEINIGSGEETRYILELLQNADDAQFPGEENQGAALKGQLTFVLSEKCLYCANTGYPLTVDGLKALCDSFLSTKTRSKPTIGFKGIGYKSVLGITEAPSIFWHDGCVAFSKTDSWGVFSKILPNIKPEQIPILRYPIRIDLERELDEDATLRKLWKTHTTVFRFPFRENIKPKEVCERLQEITPSTLLFTHHLGKVAIEALDLSFDLYSFEILRKKTDEMEQAEVITNGAKTSWLVVRKLCPVGDSKRKSFPRDTQDVETVEIAAAMEIDENSQKVKPFNINGQFPKLHVFFPTDQIVPFRILLHGNFRTNIDRRTITDDPFNGFIVSELAVFVANKVVSTISSRIDHPAELLNFFEQPSLDNWFQRILSDKVIELMKEKAIILGDATLGLLAPVDTMCAPLCIDGKRFRELLPGFEFLVNSKWKKMCAEEIEKDPKRRNVLMALGGVQLDPLDLPRIIESYCTANPEWVGKSYVLLDKTYSYMETNGDWRSFKFLVKSLAARLLLTSDGKFVQPTLPREEGIIFAPPESGVTVLLPPKTRLRFLEKKSLQLYLKEADKAFRQCYLHEQLQVKAYDTDEVISAAIVPEIRTFWEKRPALTHFEPKKMLEFLLDLLENLLDNDTFSLSRERGTLALQSLPLPVKHSDHYSQAYKTYFPKEWTGEDDLESIYGLRESYFLEMSTYSFPEEKLHRVKKLLEILGVSILPKMKEQFSPDRPDDWRIQSTWDKSARLFSRSPHAGLLGWSEYCTELSGLMEQDSNKTDYLKAASIALQSSFELDRFDMIVKDRQRAERLLKLIATNRAYFDKYLYCDVWYLISRNTETKKFPSYFAWQMKHTPWIPTVFSGKQTQELPTKVYLGTPSLKRLFHETIPYVGLSTQSKSKENDIFLLLRELGARNSIDEFESSDWWEVASALPDAYCNRLSASSTEEEVRAIYRSMLDRQDILEEDTAERKEFINNGKLLATKGKELDFHPTRDVWYTEVDRYENMFNLPIFIIKRQINRGTAVSHVFKLRSVEDCLAVKESVGVVSENISNFLNELLLGVSPFFLSRLSVEVAVKTQDQVMSRLRRLRFCAVEGLNAEYSLETDVISCHVTQEEPVLTKPDGDGYVMMYNTRMLPVFSKELTIEAAHKIGSELANYLRLSSGIGYEFAEILRKNDSDRLVTLSSAFGIQEETIEHFRKSLDDEYGTIEVVIPESEADPNNKAAVTSPYTTLDPPPSSEPEQAVYVWSLRDLKFGNMLSVEPTKSAEGPVSHGHHVDSGPGYRKDVELKKEIEIAGQDLVQEWLSTDGGYVNVKVHPKEEDRGEGWDLEASKDGVFFYFEVKSSGTNVNVVEITMPEWKKAQEKRERYYLVQVINLTYTNPATAIPPELLFVWNPYNVLAANPTRFRVRLSEFRRFNALEVKKISTSRQMGENGSP